jgi:YQGE family putative transporter
MDSDTQQKRNGFAELSLGRILLTLAETTVGVFLPIFLYELFSGNLSWTILFFILLHLVYGVLVPFGAMMLNRYGTRTPLLLGVCFSAGFIGALYGLHVSSDETGLVFLALAFIATVLFRVFFWLPFHVDLATHTERAIRGKEIGFLEAGLTIVGTLAPLIGGYMIAEYGYGMLFLTSIGIVALSFIPFALLSRDEVTFSWGYIESFKRLFAKENRYLAVSSGLMGAEHVIGAVVWPLFMFMILKGDYLQVGIVSSLIVIATVVIEIMVGDSLDKHAKQNVLGVWSFFSAIGWLVKIFVATAFQIFAVGAYHSIVRSIAGVSYESFFYELAADGGQYVDEYTVIREMAIQFAKILALVGVLVMSMVVPIQWTFLIGFGAALLLNTSLLRKGGAMPVVPESAHS